MIQVLDHAFATGAENLALEEILLQPFTRAESCPLLRVWENPEESVVIGRGEKIHERVNLEDTEKAKVPVYRRISGGGSVVHGSGNLNISFFLPYSLDEKLKSVRESYPLILGWVQNALKECTGVKPTFEGLCDLCLNQKKISGTAQARKKYGLLHHMTLLLDFDLNKVQRYLKNPDREPDYRGGRKHSDFITTFKNEGLTLNRENFIAEIVKNFKSTELYTLDEESFKGVETLANQKYHSKNWNHEGKI